MRTEPNNTQQIGRQHRRMWTVRRAHCTISNQSYVGHVASEGPKAVGTPHPCRQHCKLHQVAFVLATEPIVTQRQQVHICDACWCSVHVAARTSVGGQRTGRLMYQQDVQACRIDNGHS